MLSFFLPFPFPVQRPPHFSRIPGPCHICQSSSRPWPWPICPRTWRVSPPPPATSTVQTMQATIMHICQVDRAAATTQPRLRAYQARGNLIIRANSPISTDASCSLDADPEEVKAGG
ncbi:hypothetical protein LX36DRAFT_290215 [Colletotrichum falcatum]|nr:hypothetical protein LX36DRAFT_290215 [Colletotrichum falcatum]